MADKEQETFTAEEVRQLIKLLDQNPMGPLLVLAAIVLGLGFMATYF